MTATLQFVEFGGHIFADFGAGYGDSFEAGRMCWSGILKLAACGEGNFDVRGHRRTHFSGLRCLSGMAALKFGGSWNAQHGAFFGQLIDVTSTFPSRCLVLWGLRRRGDGNFEVT